MRDYNTLTVYCTGMKRSGSTLQYNIVRLILKRAMKDVETVVKSKNEMKGMGRYETKKYDLVKTHHPTSGLMSNIENKNIKVTYIFRDIRNVYLSIQRMQGLRHDEILSIIDNCVETYRLVKKHNGILMQKYEDVLSDISQAVSDVAKYLNYPIKKQAVHNISAECRPKTTRQKQKNISLGSKLWHKSYRMYGLMPKAIKDGLRYVGLPDLLDRLNVSRGRARSKSQLHPSHVSNNPGSHDKWRDKLSNEVKQDITTRYSQYLIENNYSVNTP